MTKILVVDDSPVDRRIAGAIVEAQDWVALYADNGEHALEAISRDKPDLVLTDLQMPGIDGLGLVERVRREHPEVPVVLMTAHGNEEVAASALRAGAASYVPKRDLKTRLGDALGNVLAAVRVRKHREIVRDCLVRSESEFVLGPDFDHLSALVGFLEESLANLDFCDQTDLFQVVTAIAEALSNAVDHGNLELDSALRDRADDSYVELRAKRSRESPWKDRRVFLSVRLDAREARYVVRDEGSGFDPHVLPDPLDPENLLKPSGRGLTLIRTFMDHVKFNDVGNEITMVKCCRKSERMS